MSRSDLDWLQTDLLRETFRDDFDTLNTKTWKACYPWGTCTNGKNEEHQFYQVDNASVRDGLLKIVARDEPGLRDVGDGVKKELPATSAMFQTSKSFSMRKGRVDFRAKSVTSKSLWPALWLLPTDETYPPEIDVFEQYGDPKFFDQNVHLPGQDVVINRFSDKGRPDVDFHEFSVQWDENRIAFAYDREITALVKTDKLRDKDMYLIIGMAVGGKNLGPPDKTTRFDEPFQIDRVVAYTYDKVEPS